MRIDDHMNGVKTVAIAGHVRPDGDCIGSSMGLYLYFQKNYPDVRVDVFLEDIPEEFLFIKDADKINHTFTTDVESYDLFICIDCEKGRTGEAEKIFDAAKKTINIDHHISNTGTGDVTYIVPTSSSACELAYDVMDKDKLDINIAQALYTGMVTDTGVFKYNSTSPKTYEIAGKLISYGFDFTWLIDHVFYEKTYLQNQILGRALLESITLMDGKVIASVVSRQTMDFYGVTGSDLDGIVNQLMFTIGTDVSIFMYEDEPMMYRVSLRSNGNIDVSRVAKLLGGGGHVRASGCTLNGTAHDAINSITKYIQQQYDEKK
ncbi:DHH domain-containing protein [Butyrivibrio proteoclasticus B316]|uniref:DHH domain-containing protein n=1 Tax=Butyrivibrio proteoclasticus (strain ATCC 51982 / DSM 14932 / B316) TaxID=515622 RepID=E0S1N5_BUTPB|nr:bifunctional oligoribonuclease/PAP phosphatase NrnA [Butyrivibrio proteoclasticus]ADL33710.1 DHH domain-containing protein [Butyrivibrio proteoclasticus B316]